MIYILKKYVSHIELSLVSNPLFSSNNNIPSSRVLLVLSKCSNITKTLGRKFGTWLKDAKYSNLSFNLHFTYKCIQICLLGVLFYCPQTQKPKIRKNSKTFFKKKWSLEILTLSNQPLRTTAGNVFARIFTAKLWSFHFKFTKQNMAFKSALWGAPVFNICTILVSKAFWYCTHLHVNRNVGSSFCQEACEETCPAKIWQGSHSLL